MNWFHGPLVAEAYDVKAPLGHSYGDVEYYLRHLEGVGGKIVELGSGTGRVLIRLLQAGLDVDGVEHSPDSIRICRAHCQRLGLDPTLFEADLATFVNEGAYEAVVIPAGTLTNLDGPDETVKALENFMASLAPGGTLILDLEIPGLLTGDQPLRVFRRGDDAWTVEIVHSAFDPSLNQMLEHVKYEKWTSGRFVSSELHTFRTQHWVPEQFVELLTSVGFVDIKVTANYDDHARPGPRDRDWSFHARKPG